LALGATAAVDPGDAPLAEAFLELAGGPPDVVFECVGVPGMIEAAVEQARLFGQVVVVGACMEQDRLHPMKAMAKEIEMRFALGHTREDFAFVVDCLARGLIDPAPMITGVVGFDGFAAAFEELRSAKEACKLLLHPALLTH
jgi:(R,R)-butanediol dehydrogenase/meso-butanediol dehydrogenase/diacetyl reductase